MKKSCKGTTRVVLLRFLNGFIGVRYLNLLSCARCCAHVAVNVAVTVFVLLPRRSQLMGVAMAIYGSVSPSDLNASRSCFYETIACMPQNLSAVKREAIKAHSVQHRVDSWRFDGVVRPWHGDLLFQARMVH